MFVSQFLKASGHSSTDVKNLIKLRRTSFLQTMHCLKLWNTKLAAIPLLPLPRESG